MRRLRVLFGFSVASATVVAAALLTMTTPASSAFQAFPDLVMSGLTVGSTYWTDGDTITFGYTITNAGDADAATSASGLYLSFNTSITDIDTLLFEDASTGTMPVGEVNPEGEPNFFVLDLDALDLLPGTYYLGAIADHRVELVENLIANNRTTPADVIAITVVDDIPDLVMSDLTVSSTNWTDGDTITFGYTITNSGTGNAADSGSGLYLSTNTFISDSDTLLLQDFETGTMSVGEVNPEGEPNVFVLDIDALGLSPGTFYLGAVADHNRIIVESDETNNATAIADVFTITVVEDFCSGTLVSVNINKGQAPTAGPDVILGVQGAETIDGLAGDDLICGGGGQDTLIGGAGHDTIYGGANADTIFGGPGNDVIWGGAANDLIYGNTENDEMHGGGGVDRIFGHDGDDMIWGDDGDDRLYGGTGDDEIRGGLGADRLWGQGDLDSLWGENDADILYGGVDADQIFGGGANDVIHGQGGADVINGGGGADTIYGHPGADTINGGTGQDIIYGHAGADVLNGDGSTDTIYGGGGADTIHGNDANDTLNGQGGNDALFGDAGTDTCDGGTGASDTATTCENTSGIP